MTIQETRGGTVTRYYKHDLWNRMVEVMHGTNVVFTCKYNGLNWLIYKQSDLTGGTGGTPNGVPDQERYRFYSANWQLLQENIDDNWTPRNRRPKCHRSPDALHLGDQVY